MVELFKAVGFGQWLRYLTGILELTGVVLIVVPKTRSIGAVLLATVMLGAIVAHLFILHTVPTMPVVKLLLSSVVVWGRRRELAHFARAWADGISAGSPAAPPNACRDGTAQARVGSVCDPSR